MTSPSTRPRGTPELVVIGGSAGALEPLLELIAGLPPAFEAPIAIVLHVARDRPSHLAEILSRRVGRRVVQAEDKQPIAPRVAYVAPPDYHLLIDAGPRVALSIDDPVNYSRPSIDVLFESAAQVLGQGVIGVLLSGANEDGARGIQAIASAGGHVMVQAPETAVNRAMPDAAIAMTPTASALSVARMCAELGRLSTGEGAR